MLIRSRSSGSDYRDEEIDEAAQEDAAEAAPKSRRAGCRRFEFPRQNVAAENARRFEVATL
jgi:hypothetical protein